MQWTGLNELREKYLSFFEGKGHLRLDSFPLVPKDDPSLLLINSGMAPMKKWFLAQEEPPRHRVTTCQKCIRTPDIERVGITMLPAADGSKGWIFPRRSCRRTHTACR